MSRLVFAAARLQALHSGLACGARALSVCRRLARVREARLARRARLLAVAKICAAGGRALPAALAGALTERVVGLAERAAGGRVAAREARVVGRLAGAARGRAGRSR